MGTDFFWFYDVVVIALVLGICFSCYRKGFVSTIIGIISVVAALIVANVFSERITLFVYNNYVSEKMEKYISENIAEIGGENVFRELSRVDTSEILINGVKLSEIEIEKDITGKTTINAKSVDLSAAGFENVDLSALGIDTDSIDFTSFDAGTITIDNDMLDEYDKDEIILSKIVAKLLQNNDMVEGLGSAIETVTESLPQGLFTGTDHDTVPSIIRVLIKSNSGNLATAVISDVIQPMVYVPLNALIAFVLFITVLLILSILARVLRSLNKIPLLGKVNSVLGGFAGIIEAAIIIVIITFGISVVINITGNELVFLNSETIEKTMIFRHIYNFLI